MTLLHIYGMFNLALVLGFGVVRLSLHFLTLTQQQALNFSRKIFILFLGIFLLLPYFITYLPSSETNGFAWQPMLRVASTHFSTTPYHLASHFNSLATVKQFPAISTVFFTLLMVGMVFYLVKYIYHIIALRSLTMSSYCQRKFHRVRILFSQDISTPFCWSSVKSDFVLMPLEMLTKKSDLNLAIRHEFQHIRQKDTLWLYLLAGINILCFFNPFSKLWQRFLSTLQEFACDEALVLRRKTTRMTYAQCLVDTARWAHANSVPQAALGMLSLSGSILNRRVTMLFQYKKSKLKPFRMVCVYAACFLTASTMAYAVNAVSSNRSLTAAEINTIATTTVTPEVVTEINHIRSNPQANKAMKNALQRMKPYQAYISAELQKKNMPSELLAVPLIESGYNVNASSAMAATGIWQIIPSTGKAFGLNVTAGQDERLNTELATQAALRLLAKDYAQFKNWKLAVLAYEIGETEVERLINKTGSRDAWKIVRRADVDEKYRTVKLSNFLSMYEAGVIIVHNPSIIR